MKRTVIIYTILFCFVFASLQLSSCSNTEHEANLHIKEIEQDITEEVDIEYLTFEQAIERATDVIKAKFVKSHEKEKNVLLEFDVNEIIKGSTETNKIFVHSFPVIKHSDDVSYISGRYNYVPDNEYILVLERTVSVYYDYDKYIDFADIYIPLSCPSDSMIYYEPLEKHASSELSKNDKDIINYVYDRSSVLSKSKDYFGQDYTRAEDIGSVVDEANQIFLVKIKALEAEGIFNEVDTYWCEIKEMIKGDIYVPTNQKNNESSEEELANEETVGEDILITFFRNQVAIDEEYLVLLNRTSDTSIMYSLSSKNSVFSLTDELVEKIIRLAKN